MQNVIRKVALARNQAKRKAILSTKDARRKEWNEFLKGQFSYNRAHLDNIRNERQRRQEDWARGPLAPRRDSGMDGKPFGTLGLEGGLRLPEIPKHMRRKYINFAKGDRVCVMKGRDKGKISEISSVDVESESVTLKDLNLCEMAIPGWMAGEPEKRTVINRTPAPISIDDIRLVVPLSNPVKDVLVMHMYGGGPFLDREYGTDTPAHTRYVAGEDIEIPWPNPEAQNHQDKESDTLRLDVETLTWVPSLRKQPFPSSVLDELRNKYSKYRTRHDPNYVKEKKLEEYKQEYLQSMSLLTPEGEHRAIQQAKKANSMKGKQDGKGNMIMSRETAAFIERFMRENKGDKASKAT
ncbi:KOW motif domain protein [Aspergillus sclerotialis]|uniref:KOW motif domain protein n=1 Tax=Aspergillus sclerotialis TaxID=2070753 RepID=A0A3A3A2Z4_9EURO|nr:KOW motif domain protein [Aspergillus sclerotialis]